MAWSKKKGVVPKKELMNIFKPATDLKIDDGLKMGMYSRSKLGKTHIICTAAEFAKRGPLFIIDTENNVKKETSRLPLDQQNRIFVTEVLKLEESGVERKKKVDVIRSLDLVMEATDVLTDIIQDSITNPDSLYKRGTVAIDSGTDIWQWLGVWLTDEADIKKTQKGDMPRFEWGKANKRYIEFMYMLLNSNWNVIMSFRSEAAVGSTGEDLGHNKARWQKDTDFWLDLICELDNDGQDFRLFFRGDRFGQLKGSITDPSFERVIKEINRQSGAIIL